MYKPPHCDQTLTSCQTAIAWVKLTKTTQNQCSVTPLRRHTHIFYFSDPPKHVVTFFEAPGRYFLISKLVHVWKFSSNLWHHDCAELQVCDVTIVHVTACMLPAYGWQAGVIWKKLGTMYAREIRYAGWFCASGKRNVNIGLDLKL